ncbi:choice-of-anchor L domain-containing protein [Geminocystis sp. NIES-3709]|uniref:choice-of-anchor L domain-containing protein n=1 Tax=Geminocystis sp. NIES-3709 TaxID=1617448 RepID=UPI0005FCC01B|nr:choice-of-anchor L domain-containing protein [Geminocystis sp. NIES-3709]BAQ64346.1 alkaline phosphatase [Geminocystis sp. NIES-3709]
MVTPFSVYSGGNNSLLTNALLSVNSGINVNLSSIKLNTSAPSAVNFYDGSLIALGIGSGLLLTSGTTPGTSNTSTGFGSDNSVTTGFYNGDADIDAVVNTVFQTQSYDATSLTFDFTVTDPNATSITFDLVFGSDEYPEWVDAFVDSAIVLVNGVNYALFNHDPLHPLSVISSNLAAGYFQDNANNILPIEYDGVSHVLKIVAPIIAGGTTNHIKIGISDTGDHILDSGIFLSNFSAGNTPGSGVVSTPTSTTDGNDVVTGSAQDELIDLKGGDDIAYAGAGDDIVIGGAGNDSIYGGSGNNQLKGDTGSDYLEGGDGTSDTAVFAGASTEYSLVYNSVNNSYTVTDSKTGATAEGTDTLTNIELAKFNNGLFNITNSGFSPISSPPPTPTNTPGSVIISGIASVGNVLTATVSDPDGISGSINYQWQSSSNNDTTWNNIGTNSNTYTVTSANTGLLVQVIASYTDNDAIAESPVSPAKEILNTKSGDLVVTLIQLKAPSGASNINPLTTLVQDAIDLGLSPNTASNTIKTVLGIPSTINLQSYDAYAILQTNPTQAQALAVEKVAVQVAILTSLSDDDTGLNLTSAIIKASASNKTLNLANANDLASILGVNITGLTKNNYPEPLREIFDRNKSMSDAIADGGDVSVIEQEWQDLLSIQDGINSTSIADLSIHVNQNPIGTATADLANGIQGSPYQINSTDLLTGFSDPDGGILGVTNLSASIAGTFTNNNNSTWTFTLTSNYTGPIELNYTVIDGQGGSTSANQLFVISPQATNPIFTGTSKADTLIGTTGADILIGLAGNDTYTVNDSGDVVIEELSAGTDTVYVTVSYSLSSNVEKLILQGTAINGTGNELNNTITGNTSNNVLTGGAGNDILDGGTGSDSLIGGLGNDTYQVDMITDVITELANQGTDTVKSTVSYSLSSNVERLMLQGTAINGTGNELNNTITGNASNNVLSGGAGNDILDGGTGSDSLIGGLGNDTYQVDMITDVITELANQGTDTVKSSASYSLSSNVERLVLQGTAINGTGNELNNTITGNASNNVLSGGAGSDILTGNAGSDILTGNAGTDILVGNTDNDTLNLGLNDSVADIVRYSSGDGSDIINQFVKGIDKLSFTGISSIDVKISGSNTQLSLGNGIVGDAGFGTGSLLMTIKGVIGFTSAELGVNGTSVDLPNNTAQFLFS